jgi:hypothetical protein
MTDSERCVSLRTKNGYGEVTTPDGDGWAVADGSDACWCVLTGRALGPDGGLVALGRCGRSRPCYRHPEDVAPRVG